MGTKRGHPHPQCWRWAGGRQREEIDKEKSRGGTSSKGRCSGSWACLDSPMWHNSEMTFASMGDTEDDEVKKRYRYPSL